MNLVTLASLVDPRRPRPVRYRVSAYVPDGYVVQVDDELVGPASLVHAAREAGLSVVGEGEPVEEPAG